LKEIFNGRHEAQINCCWGSKWKTPCHTPQRSTLTPNTPHELFWKKIASQYDIADAIVFGSRARHNHTPYSDADIAILLRGKPGKFVLTKLAMADIAYDVLLT